MQPEKFNQKAVLRNKFTSLRNSINKKDVEIKSRKIFQIFFKNVNTNKFKKFLLYLPINSEVDTKLIIDALVLEYKQIYLPKFLDNVWILTKFENWRKLEKGPYGILQPKNHAVATDLDVAVIPGVAFARDGTRLGYGKGVYDKLLANFDGLKVGLAYNFQIVDKLPWEEHDLKMDMVITDRS